jgi:choline-sulfatase
MTPRKPNILFIMVDQLAAPALQCYGNSVAKTPNINRLVNNGTLFETNYCNFPICAPSRFSMLSGRLASRIGVYDSGHEFTANSPTIMHYLRHQGYQTALSGKMHFIGPDQLHGYEERLNTDIYPSQFNWIADWKTALDESSTGGLKGHQTLDDRVRSGGKVKRTLQLDYDEETAFLGVQKIYDLARSDDKRPFFLTVSFSHPHDPFEATGDFWNLYNDDEIAMPTVPRLDAAERDIHSSRLMAMYGADHDILTDAEILRARHAYFANISYIDAKIGELMNALKATDFDKNTIIVFTSDHGEMLGERGLWFKFCFYEWSMRVPLIIQLPDGQGAGVRAQGHSSLVDLLPTLVELANDGKTADYVTPLDGHSLSGAFQRAGHTGKDITLAEYSAEGALAPQVMLRKGNFKLIHCRTDPALLFDLGSDPHERTNLAGSPEHAAVQTKLEAQLSDHWDLKQLETAVLEGQKRHLFLRDTLAAGIVPSWDYQPKNDAAKKYVRTMPGIDKAERRLPRVTDT